jgi:hypothetical protein
MYDPSIGRWLEEDPMGFDAGQSNLSQFVGNDPVNGSDPSGKQRPVGNNGGQGNYNKEMLRGFQIPKDYGLNVDPLTAPAPINAWRQQAIAYIQAWTAVKKANAAIRSEAEALQKRGVVQHFTKFAFNIPSSTVFSVTIGREVYGIKTREFTFDGITHTFDWKDNLSYLIERSKKLDTLIDQAIADACKIILNPSAESIQSLERYGSRIGNTFLALGAYYDTINASRLVDMVPDYVTGSIGFIHALIDISSATHAILDKLESGDANAMPAVLSATTAIRGYLRGVETGGTLMKVAGVLGKIVGIYGTFQSIFSLTKIFKMGGGAGGFTIGANGGVAMNLSSGVIITVSAAERAALAKAGVDVFAGLTVNHMTRIDKDIYIVDHTGKKDLAQLDGFEITDTGELIGIERKTAGKLNKLDPKTGRPFPGSDETTWANKQIYEAGKKKVEAIENGVSTRGTSTTDVVPDIRDIRQIRKLRFEVDSDTPALRGAVNNAMDRLRKAHPDFQFEVTFAGKP